MTLWLPGRRPGDCLSAVTVATVLRALGPALGRVTCSPQQNLASTATSHLPGGGQMSVSDCRVTRSRDSLPLALELSLAHIRNLVSTTFK